jgi:AcrR family transcriptional regulator
MTTTPEPDTADKILAAAAELFGERGYKATTTRAIAERAGVNEVTVFRRFTNKQGVLAALGEAWKTRMAGFAVDTLPDPADTRATLEHLARLEVSQAAQVGAVMMRLAMDAAVSPEIAEWLGAGSGDNFAGLASYLAERQAAGDLRADLDASVIAEAFFALTSGLVLSRQVTGRAAAEGLLGLDDASRQAFELFAAGVGLKRS